MVVAAFLAVEFFVLVGCGLLLFSLSRALFWLAIKSSNIEAPDPGFALAVVFAVIFVAFVALGLGSAF